MSETTVNLTPEVVETIYDLQQRDYASLHVDVLQRVLTGIIRDDMGSDEERLNWPEKCCICKTPCVASYCRRTEIPNDPRRDRKQIPQ